MLLSQLIKHLEGISKVHGDIEVLDVGAGPMKETNLKIVPFGPTISYLMLTKAYEFQDSWVQGQNYISLWAHLGHNFKCITYGWDQNVSLECKECNKVIMSFDKEEDVRETQ